MSHAAHNLDQEFWRPPVQNVQVQEVSSATEVCSRCSTEFVVGSRFCHVCGAGRDPEPQSIKPSAIRFLDLRLLGNALGLTIASLIAFFAGIVCVIAAVSTGFIYTAATVLDWQAVQIWRIEWMLAAAVAFIAGILLKRTGA
jgi:hypothetical protein